MDETSFEGFDDDSSWCSDVFPSEEGTEHNEEQQAPQPIEPPPQPAPLPPPSNNAHLYVFTNEKAGMVGCDKALQQRVIDDMSRGSKHFQHARRMDEKLTIRVDALRKVVSQQTPIQQTTSARKGADLLRQFEKERRDSRWCCVLDMDMFFAAVEIKDNPSLADKPVAVGGMSMISTTNYIARQYGVRAAMPGFIGKELCARQGVELIFVHSGHKRYAEESERFKEVVGRYGPYSALSGDEVTLDLTEAVQKAALAEHHRLETACIEPLPSAASLEYQCAEKLLTEVRTAVFDATQLTASGSIATNFMLAKMGADVNKPNGQFMAPRTREGVIEWMRPLPVRKIPFVGKVTERLLKEALNLHTAGDVLDNAGTVVFALEGMKSAGFLLRSALGIGKDELSDYSNRPEGSVARQTVGAERTFSDLTNEAKMFEMLEIVSKKASESLQEANLSGKSVILKLKKSDFSVSTRQAPLATYINTPEAIFKAASPILTKEIEAARGSGGLSLRLMGVRMAKFSGQVSYKEARDTKQRRLDTFFKSPKPNRDAGNAESDDDDVVCFTPEMKEKKGKGNEEGVPIVVISQTPPKPDQMAPIGRKRKLVLDATNTEGGGPAKQRAVTSLFAQNRARPKNGGKQNKGLTGGITPDTAIELD